MKKYQIADFIFGIHMEESLEIPENFKKFLIDTDEEVQVEYFLEIVDKLPELDGECVSQRIDLKVYKKDDLEYRRMNFMGMEESYGQYEEISQDQVKLYLKREFVHMINVDTVFVSLFAMEKRMLAKDAMVLHCSVLKVKSGVILFSGPSGIGKSTQAGLWMKYRKARVINGDRTLLKKENGRCLAAEDNEIEITAGIDKMGAGQYTYPVFSSLKEWKGEADVIVDFSAAAAVDELLDFCEETKMPVVLCTTGLSDSQIRRAEEVSKSAAIVRSANMSLGVNLLLKLVAEAAKVLAGAHIIIQLMIENSVIVV